MKAKKNKTISEILKDSSKIQQQPPNVDLYNNSSYTEEDLIDLLYRMEQEICIVDLHTQTMMVQLNNDFKKTYLISSAAIGINNIMNSQGTPLGQHIVFEKIGENAPIYTIFEARENKGYTCTWLNNPDLNHDLILTRILRLKGLEWGINLGFNGNDCVDSYDRYIYIHGTNREDLLGTPSSRGCIRMGNQDIIELFDKINVGTPVFIYERAPKLKF